MSIRITAVSGISSDSKYEAWELVPAQIPAAWDELEPLVMSALAHSQGELSPEDIKRLLCIGVISALTMAVDGRIQLMLIVELVQWPQYKSIRVVLAAGKGLKEARRFIPALEAWALVRGAVEIEAWCRPAMVRLLRHFNFHKTYEIVRYDLRSKLQ